MPEKTLEKKDPKLAEGRYIEAIGRRKTATARVRIFNSSKTSFEINGRSLESYFPTKELQTIAKAAFKESGATDKFKVSAHISGGGIHSQSEALRHGIARALVDFDSELRKKLKKFGFLKRNPRVKERRKFGLKKARKAPQWSKR